MKTIRTLLAVHKTFEPNSDGVKELSVYLYDGKKVIKLSWEKLYKTVTDIAPGTVVRTTAVGALDSLIKVFEDAGAKVVYAPWHSTGLAKGLEPSELVKAYYDLPESLFRPFVYNSKLASLKEVLALRNAVVQMHGDSMRRVRQIGRNIGLVTDAQLKENDNLKQTVENLDAIYDCFVGVNTKGKEISLDTKISHLAKEVPECVLFNQVAGIKDAWITAASVMSIIQNIDRFETVAGLWKYFGQDVRNGKAPKKEKGLPCTWSPEGRKVLYQLGDSIIKNTNNPWRKYFDEVKERELAKHDEVCSCKYRSGHANARARRKTVKEILKKFFVLAKGQEFRSQNDFVNHRIAAAASGN